MSFSVIGAIADQGPHSRNRVAAMVAVRLQREPQVGNGPSPDCFRTALVFNKRNARSARLQGGDR